MLCHYNSNTHYNHNTHNAHNVAFLHFLVENFTIFFQMQEKLKNLPEFEFDKFWKITFWRWYACNIYIVAITLRSPNTPPQPPSRLFSLLFFSKRFQNRSDAIMTSTYGKRKCFSTSSYTAYYPFKCQPYNMVKHTQTIRRQKHVWPFCWVGT